MAAAATCFHATVPVITKDLFDARMALLAREKMIALHPMAQALEEKHGQENIRNNHSPGMKPQFMLRVGYLDKDRKFYNLN